MANGIKTGGRQKGTPNQRSVAVFNKLSEMKCDPIEGMARIAMQAEDDAVTCFEAFIKALQDAVEENAPEEIIQLVTKGVNIKIRERLDHLNLAGAMYKELAQYIAPKRKSMEFDPGADDPNELVCDESQLAAMARTVLRNQQPVPVKPLPKPIPKPIPIIKNPLPKPEITPND